jgi:hypothetical protein
VDAGLWTPGRVEARVWWDRDGNGQQDTGEAGENLSGVTVRLLDAGTNAVLNTALTGGNGIATISGVPADRPVKLQFVSPQNTSFTLANRAGVNDLFDSDADATSGETVGFQASRGGQLHDSWDGGLRFNAAYVSLVNSCGYTFNAATYNQLLALGVVSLADCHIVGAGTASGIANAQVDRFVNANDRVAKILVGYGSGGATVSGTPRLWYIGNDGTSRAAAINTVIAGTQMWEATIDFQFVDWSADGRYLVANIARYGTTSGAGSIAGRFGVYYRIDGCAVGVNCNLGLSGAAQPLWGAGSLVNTVVSPTRPLYLTAGLAKATGIALRADGSYLVTGLAANGNLFNGNNAPPLDVTTAGDWTLPAAP